MKTLIKLFIGLFIILTGIHSIFAQGQPLAKIRIDENGNVQVLENNLRETETNGGIKSQFKVPLQKSLPNLSEQYNVQTELVNFASKRDDGNNSPKNPGPNLTIDIAHSSSMYNRPYLSMSVRIINNGTSQAYPNTMSYVLYSNPPTGIIIGTDDVPGLDPGTYVDLSATIPVYQPGTYYVGFAVDINNEVSEDNESDNYYYFHEPLYLIPDLAVYDIEVLDNVGPEIHCRSAMTNLGNGDAGMFYYDYFLSSDIYIAPSDYRLGDESIVSGGLSVDAIVLLEFKTTVSGIPQGEYYMGMYLDVYDNVAELCETNNTGYDGNIKVLISGVPDLVVTDVAVSDYTSPQISYQFSVKNQGSAGTGGGFSNAVYLSTDQTIIATDYKINEKQSSALAAGATFNSGTVQTTISGVPAGDYYLGIFADRSTLISESDENNNTGYDDSPKVTIQQPSTPYPDLVVPQIAVTDHTGPQIEYHYTVQNEGNDGTGQPFTNHVYLSTDTEISQTDYKIDSQQFAALNSGSQNNSGSIQTQISGVPAGDYYLGVYADGANSISESNEHNNTACESSDMVNCPAGTEETVILDMPMAGTAPVIDGEMDCIWYSVQSIPMEKPIPGEFNVSDNWLDCYACFKMMYDANNAYFFIQAHDDIVDTSSPDAWKNDSFEIYFDGDNSKNDASAGYDGNDVQLRYVYGETTDNMNNAPNSICKFLDTDYGYNLEIQVPVSDMPFDLTPDHIFGFDIQFNDNDGGEQDHVLKWWSDSNDSWLDASLFGTARTTDYVASDPMYILQTEEAPVIDGTDDDAVWDNIPWISGNTFVDRENGTLSNPALNLANVDGCNDCRFDYKLMWRGDMLYLYARVFDDIIEASQSEFWNNDCFEIQIDGNNDKTPSTDSNDMMYTFVYSETPEVDAAFQTTSQGWTVEAQMDLAGDLGVSLSMGHQIGLEVQVDDNDGSGRDLIGRWWSNDNITWINPSMRGTAELTGEQVETFVKDDQDHAAVKSFYLAQNYPNPFNPATTISFSIPKDSYVKLTVFDVLGKEISTLVNDNLQAGEHHIVFEPDDLPNGVYVYKLKADQFVQYSKMLLVR